MDDFALKARGAIGIVVILALAWLLSSNRRKVRPRIVLYGLGLQFAFALIVLRTDVGRAFFDRANGAIQKLLDFSREGAAFVFGPLSIPAGEEGSLGFMFFFQPLVTIIFFASLMAVLYHLGIMQFVVRGVAWVMVRTLRTSGAETLSASANIFVGQTEAPLVVKPFIAKMTRSEIMAIMTGGFATVAGGVMATYVSIVRDVFPNIAGHLMAASVMAAPAGLMMAKILVPETERPETAGGVSVEVEKTAANTVDAAAAGAADGMKLVLNVAAMLFAFVAMVALLNFGLGKVGGWFGHEELSLQWLLQYAFAPLTYAMGVESGDVLAISKLLGEKLVLTEFVAYMNLGEQGAELSERSVTIASYALCGFANFASIAIQIGGISAMAPERRSVLAELGVKAMFAGFLTTCLTATVAGLLV
ncbi:MAG: NupC/NupG family nucleoside CNT transporter [Planctomycetota bacterium JB042]